MSDSSSIPPSDRPKRRKRYSGKNPRRFEDKYKEHQPDQYPETVQKVLQSGKTPAGSHRPIMVAEILDILNPQSGEIGVDATLGYGGHTTEILPQLLPDGKLFAFDQDPIEFPKTETRLRARGFSPENLILTQTNFAALPQILAKHQISAVDFILADLGCSSMQLDDPQRGFTFKTDGPLDLRMNPNRGQSAAAFLSKVEEKELSRILKENSDEPYAELLAQAMTTSPSPIQTTRALSQVVEQALSSRVRKEEISVSIRRVFQALRISINEEFKNLERFLDVLPACLKSGGRVTILTFHSGEDGRVKKAFQSGYRDGLYSKISDDLIRASQQEVRANPRSSSAKLRWAIKA